MEPGGQFDMQQLFAAAAQMGSQFMSARQRMADTKVEGSAGGGLVKVTVNGDGELTDLTIAKEVVEPDDPEETTQTIADLVLAACRDAYRALGEVQDDVMGPLAGGLIGGLGGTAGPSGQPSPPGIPGLPGLPGFPPPPGVGRGGQPGQADRSDASNGED